MRNARKMLESLYELYHRLVNIIVWERVKAAIEQLTDNKIKKYVHLKY